MVRETCVSTVCIPYLKPYLISRAALLCCEWVSERGAFIDAGTEVRCVTFAAPMFAVQKIGSHSLV